MSDRAFSPEGTLARWELVGKQEQQESRASIQLLKSLYDRKPIWERYESGTLEIHSHLAIRGTKLCITFSAHENPMLGHRGQAVDGEVHLYRHKFPVFVGIRKVTENARPFASSVRLKLANDCGVLVAHAFETGAPMRRETLLRILDGKLRSALGCPGVVLCQDVDEVVQRGSQVVNDLSDQNARAIAERVDDPRGWLDLLRFKIYVCEDAVFAELDDLSDDTLQVGQVFFCPFSTQEGALEFIHRLASPRGAS